jgi:death-on-curing protein
MFKFRCRCYDKNCCLSRFLAAHVFLYLCGWELMASEAEAVVAVLALAAGEMDEAGFSNWLASNSVVRSALE